MTLDAFWLDLAVATVLPMLVALVTAQIASAAVKAVILAVLAGVGGVLVQVQQANGTFDWDAALKTWVAIFLVAVGLHFGLLKPVAITGAGGVIQKAVPAGLGGRSGALESNG